MTENERNTYHFFGLPVTREDLKTIAEGFLWHAQETADPASRLASIDLSSRALRVANLTVEDIGIQYTDVIALVNLSGHKIALPEAADILSSYPRR